MRRDLPDNLVDVVQELLNAMDADIYYDAADYEDWGPQESIDYLFELRAHVQRLLKKEQPEPKLCSTCGQGLSDCLTFGCFAGANDGCGPDSNTRCSKCKQKMTECKHGYAEYVRAKMAGELD